MNNNYKKKYNNSEITPISIHFSVKGGVDDDVTENVAENVTENKELSVEALMEQISDHLKRFDYHDNPNVDENKNSLKIGNNEINYKCMLHFLSGDADYLSKYKNDCSQILIDNYTNESDNLELTKLISVSGISDFTKDSTFYSNLYEFIINMVSYLSTDEKFKKISVKSQRNMLVNLQAFIKQSIHYTKEYMTKHKVINNTLINNSYNLLYIMYNLTLKHANTGKKDLADLQNVYEKLCDAININLDTYNKINIKNFEQTQSTNPDTTDITLQAMIKTIKKKTEELTEQSKQMQINIDKINAETSGINNLVNDNIKDIIKNIHKK